MNRSILIEWRNCTAIKWIIFKRLNPVRCENKFMLALFLFMLLIFSFCNRQINERRPNLEKVGFSWDEKLKHVDDPFRGELVYSEKKRGLESFHRIYFTLFTLNLVAFSLRFHTFSVSLDEKLQINGSNFAVWSTTKEISGWVTQSPYFFLITCWSRSPRNSLRVYTETRQLSAVH